MFNLGYGDPYAGSQEISCYKCCVRNKPCVRACMHVSWASTYFLCHKQILVLVYFVTFYIPLFLNDPRHLAQ